MGNRRKPTDQRAEIRDLKAKAAEIDRLRDKQAQNQINSMTRLLGDPDHVAEITELNRQLAELQVQLEKALEGAPQNTGWLASSGS